MRLCGGDKRLADLRQPASPAMIQRAKAYRTRIPLRQIYLYPRAERLRQRCMAFTTCSNGLGAPLRRVNRQSLIRKTFSIGRQRVRPTGAPVAFYGANRKTVRDAPSSGQSTDDVTTQRDKAHFSCQLPRRDMVSRKIHDYEIGRKNRWIFSSYCDKIIKGVNLFSPYGLTRTGCNVT